MRPDLLAGLSPSMRFVVAVLLIALLMAWFGRRRSKAVRFAGFGLGVLLLLLALRTVIQPIAAALTRGGQ